MSDYPPWKMSLVDYLGPYFVELTDHAFDSAFVEHLKQRIFLADRNDFKESIHVWRPDIRFLVKDREPDQISGMILVECVRTGERVGGLVNGTHFVREDRRCRGIGSEIIFFSDINDGFKSNIIRYTASSFETQKAAYLLHIKRVLMTSPHLVSEDALSWVETAEDGNAIFLKKWTAEDQNQHAMRLRIKKRITGSSRNSDSDAKK